MKKWIMAKSLTVRIALMVLTTAVVAEVAVGAVWATKKLSGKKTVTVAEVETLVESTDIVEDSVVEPEIETVTVPTVTEAVKPVEEEEYVVENIAYVKTSTNLENGDFSSGLDAWEVYSFVEDNIDYTTDNEVFKLTMGETGTEDWHVQLKQNGVRLEKGKWYSITLDAKSSLNRTITCAIQRDGMIHNDDWTPYANAKELSLTSTWKTYTYVFQMNENTDNAAVFMLSLGAVNGRRITTEHTISIDNVRLNRLADNWTDMLRDGENLIANPDFAYESLLWEPSVVAPGVATVSFTGNKASFDISNVGTLDWHVQLKQGGIKLENNTGYRMTFTVSSSVARTIKLGFMDTNYVNWYGGSDISLNGTENQVITVDFYNSIGANDNALLMLSMGKIEGVDSPAGKIEFSNFKLVKCSDVAASSNAGAGSWTDPNHYFAGGWVAYDHESTHTNGMSQAEDGTISISIVNTGSLDWHVQLQNKNISLTQGKYYQISYEAKSTVARKIGVAVQRNGANDDDWTPYTPGSNVVSIGTEWATYVKTFKMTNASDAAAIYNFSLGLVDGESVGAHVVSFRNIKIQEVSAPVIPDIIYQIGDEILKNGGAISPETWGGSVDSSNAAGSITISDGKIIAVIDNAGTNSWDVQVKQEGVKVEKGCTYKVRLSMTSTVEREIKVDFLHPDTYEWIGGETLIVGPAVGRPRAIRAKENTNDYEFNIAISGETEKQAIIAISLGKMDGDTPASTIVISNVSVEKATEAGNTDSDENENNSSSNVPTGVVLYQNEAGIEAPDWNENLDIINEAVKTAISEGKIKPGTVLTFTGKKVADDYMLLSVINSGWESIIDGTSGDERTDLNGMSEGNPESITLTREMINRIVAGGIYLNGHGYKIYYVSYQTPEGSAGDESDDNSGDNDSPSIPTPSGTILYQNADGLESPEWGASLNVLDAPIKAAITGGQIKVGTVLTFVGEKTADDYQSIALIDNSWTSIIDGTVGDDRTVLRDMTLNTPVTLTVTQDIIDRINADEILINGHGFKIYYVSYQGGASAGDLPAPEEKWEITVVENKAIEQIPGDKYNLSSFVGKNVRITAVLAADRMFKGAIGGGSEGATDDWKQGAEFESSDGSEMTWTVEIPNFTGSAQIQLYWAEATKVEIKSVTVEEVVSEQTSDLAKTELNLTFTLNEETPEEGDGTYKGAIEFNPQVYMPEYTNGTSIVVSVTFDATDGFGGAISGSKEDGWHNGAEHSESAGTVTWKETISNSKDLVKIDIWWSNASVLTYYNIKVEEDTTSAE